MDKVKPWQIILFVVATAALGFSVWKFALSGRPKLPQTVTLVDVQSGDLFELDISGRRAAYYPEKHPETGDRTLLPVVKQPDGQWRISGHSLPALEDVRTEASAVEDRSTGRVRVNEGRPKKISL